MAKYELILPSMGEGVMEATIIKWVKNVGDPIEEDDSVVEIATDKVDSDVPSPISGKLVEILVQENEIAQVEQVIAILEIEGEESESVADDFLEDSVFDKFEEVQEATIIELEAPLKVAAFSNGQHSTAEVFLSPLVKSIAQAENVSIDELRNITGTGKEGRVTKEDILTYVSNRSKPFQAEPKKVQETVAVESAPIKKPVSVPQHIPISGGDEIIEMDRMRKLIAQHMVHSKQTSPHVTSFVETDMTAIVKWREKVKDNFLKNEGAKLTYMPIIIQALVKAIKDFPMINASVDGDKIIKKKNINIGMATALPSGNLIVPVIKNADELSLSGLAKKINDLAKRARENNLKPDEIQGGTYTITNIGSFGNILGTPIINQPQVAIMAVGAIEKKPAVIETPDGDLIGIRHKMYLSHAYDHRVVDGALGGMFVKRFSDYLEQFDTSIGF